ncbi:hypothetical protein I7I50_01272 [Histoplasma capsulatum G186AR]|uniref:Uncharacterized protein n=1 Tax=Ajellomyces capsulatus TaxID=5037 RepID=A0A8H7YXB7_AJECA|nr:hypothetical protein I7I52_08901 [Histoplasma capsulatum]QSS73196.1 hypothetical protein I7I50_01272 [Histoplasma capsulatum G186AR]
MEKITPCFGSQFHTALHKPLYYFVLTFQTLNLPLCFSQSHTLLSPFLSPTTRTAQPAIRCTFHERSSVFAPHDCPWLYHVAAKYRMKICRAYFGT